MSTIPPKKKSKLSRLCALFRPPIKAAPLCSFCQSVNFWSDPDATSERDINFTFDYQNYQARQPRCPFCTLILHRLPQFRLPGYETIEPVDVRLQIKGQQAFVWNNGRHLGRIRSSSVSLEYKVELPRWDVIDTELVKGWLKDENRNNNDFDANRLGTARHREPVDLILVDTELGCLVQRSSDRQYFALSYVWGGTPMLQTTLSNFAELQLEGAVRHHPALPKAVHDAIDLVRKIGERYLWVDCLCIVQDSDTKHKEISRMDLIYSQAVLTIVAVDGQNADTPLPGVHASSRLPIAKLEYVGGTTLISLPPMQLNSVLDSSVYESRGWTLQERVLSKRLLYLSAQGMFLQDSRSFISEYMLYLSAKRTQFEETQATFVEYGYNNTQLVYDTPLTGAERTALLVRKVNQHSPKVNVRWLSRPSEDWSKLQRWDVLLPTYQDFVEMYSSRNLSYNSDALNAFAGISAMIGNAGETGFASGLPGVVLASSLLWTGKCALTRRRNEAGQCLFPSWSWAGWIGPIIYPSILRGKLVRFPAKEPLFVLPTSRPMRTLRRREGDDGLPDVDLLSFGAEYMECHLFIHRRVKDPRTGVEYAIFSADSSTPPCGFLYCDNMPIGADASRYSLILLDFDLDRTSENELRAMCSLNGWQRMWGRFPAGTTLYVMLVKENARHCERVAVGKMLAGAWRISGNSRPTSGTTTMPPSRDSGYASLVTHLDNEDALPVASTERRKSMGMVRHFLLA